MKYVIIGGDAAGMSAAMEIVRNEESANITTLEMGSIYSYAQCGLPYVVGGVIPQTEKLIARTIETFRNKYGIDARTNHEVTKIDPDSKHVYGANFEIPYDKLLIATGARPLVPNWPGRTLAGIHTIKTIPDTEVLLADLKGEIKNVVIVGGGYIGLEMAENLALTGKNVTIVEANAQLAAIFDQEMGEIIHQEAERKGVTLRLKEEVKGFEGTDRVQAVVTSSATVPAELVIIAIGVVPNTTFLEGQPFHRHENSALKVNAYMETNLPDIYAAGDCATQYHRIKKMDDYIPLGTHANKQGRLAGLNMVGKRRAFAGVVGTSIIKFFDLSLGRTGLSEKETRDARLPASSITFDGRDIAGYYPGAEPLKIKLVYHSETNQLLGGQVIGTNGVAKRVDVLATALYQQLTLEELLDLDLSYAPPFNGVWDPIQQAARRA